MKYVKTFEGFLNESISVRDNGIRDGVLYVDINGREYGYGEIKGGADLEEIARKFRKMLQFSSGRALAWLKKNTDLVSGSTKNEAEDIKAAIGSLEDFINEAYYEMFSPAGEKACQSLVDSINKKITGSKRLTMAEIQDLYDTGRTKISKRHPEVFDTEPRYHIADQINKTLKEVGYGFRFNGFGELVKESKRINEASFPDRAWHIKFAKAKDDEALKMLKDFYGEEIMGEDFYPGPGTDKTMELSNDKFASLFDKGLIVAVDPDDFIYKVAE